MKKLLTLVAIFVFALFWKTSLGQQGKFQAVFIFNFYKQMEWPANYKTADFVIGIIGDSPVAPMLEKLKASQTGKTRFVITRFNTVNEISKCNMLFIPQDKSDLLETTLKKLNGTATLIITEKPGLGGKGSSINFVESNDRLRFEMNETALKKSNIKVSDMLRSLAIIL